MKSYVCIITLIIFSLIGFVEEKTTGKHFWNASQFTKIKKPGFIGFYENSEAYSQDTGRKNKSRSKTSQAPKNKTGIDNKSKIKDNKNVGQTQPINQPSLVTGTLTDSRDNNTYSWVLIGGQAWLSKNMAYLPFVNKMDSGSYSNACYYVYDYNMDDVYKARSVPNYYSYGVLYNWTAAKTACPSGWHLPTDEEWKQLEIYLGMSPTDAEKTKFRGSPVGAKLKAPSGWINNGNGTNESGFSGNPGGWRHTAQGGKFNYSGFSGYYWTSTELSQQYAGEEPMHAYYREITQGSDRVSRYLEAKAIGISVRCVRN